MFTYGGIYEYTEMNYAMNFYQKLFCLEMALLFIIAFSGCSVLDAIGERNSDLTADETKENSGSYFQSYYCYQSRPGFDEWVAENVIDFSYVAEQDQILTESEMEDCERKYIEIWKKELSWTMEELYEYLDSEEKEQIRNSLSELENSMQAVWSFEYGIRNTQNEGSSLLFHQLFEEKEWYRDQTIRMKYLIYSKRLSAGEQTPDVIWHTEITRKTVNGSVQE